MFGKEERRFFERIDTDVSAIIFLHNPPFEVNAKVVNISENGICFHIDKSEFFEISDIRAVTLIDEFNYLGKTRKEILNIEIAVLRSYYTSEYLELGCRILHDKKSVYEHYVESKKVVNYIKRGYIK